MEAGTMSTPAKKVETALDSLHQAVASTSTPQPSTAERTPSSNNKVRMEALLEKYTAADPDFAADAKLAEKMYRPWNYDDFLARVHTFRPSLWFAKPSGISAIKCAQHGWCNVGPNALHCSLCEVSVTHTDQEDGVLLAAHAADCAWLRPSPEAFLLIPNHHKPRVLLDELDTVMRRGLELFSSARSCHPHPSLSLDLSLLHVYYPEQLATLGVLTSLHVVDASAAPHIATSECMHSRIHRMLRGDAETDPALVGAWLLAVTGWEYRAEVDRLCCRVCRRQCEVQPHILPGASMAVIENASPVAQPSSDADEGLEVLVGPAVGSDGVLVPEANAGEEDAGPEENVGAGPLEGVDTAGGDYVAVQAALQELVHAVTAATQTPVPSVQPLNLLGEHRYWCPWARQDTFTDSKERRSAWALCVDALDEAHGRGPNKRPRAAQTETEETNGAEPTPEGAYKRVRALLQQVASAR